MVELVSRRNNRHGGKCLTVAMGNVLETDKSTRAGTKISVRHDDTTARSNGDRR